MRKSIYLATAVLALGLLLFLWRARNVSPPHEVSTAIASAGNDQSARQVEPASNPPAETRQLPRPPLDSSATPNGPQEIIEEQAARRRALERKWKAQWSTPIDFFGKVVDEVGNPVPDASVLFERVNIRGDGLQSSATSDSSGLFSLTGVQGRDLSVHVSKPGYYTSVTSQQSAFLYSDLSGRGTFTPDRLNPVIFRVRRKGPGVQLLTSQRGAQPVLALAPPIDGTPLKVDLFRKQTDSSGQLQISQVKPDRALSRDATEWSFEMSIPDGGFVPCQDEFPFEAPETNYQATVSIHPRQGDTNWTHIAASYYIKFGEPPRYGHLRIQTDIYRTSVFLGYSINPDGSRYLEPK